ncbi:sigma-70 family RNA polymerase sigma factor [Paenibacillus sp. ACRRX]|uniref:sigma-70 family RNA polymerase sigma factor n=1 Tax=unclassified Paenibacillus TaxID=185978 RepID=UPI001EF47B3E|nr:MULTISPECIES: sigma-70 family RNA polymerase sigma factor [unclassified Paenibacillus]MCG7408215.1 sigma-70 family RNA polymerase sigma factor [Paenibacillus sp. ACRRX]MDK8181400.1 sigma-70 family RNA polymerase sigma factor [Paenibacillus sp. UMB4589-SE434]
MKELNITPLIIRMRAGDTDAFQQLYHETKDYTYRLIYFLAPNKQDTADMMSEVYLELFRAWDKYDPEQPFYAWMNGIIVRQVRSWNRGVWRRFRLLERVKSHGAELPPTGMDDHLYALHAQMEVLPVVELLSQKLKEVIVLRYVHDYTLQDIAMILDIPVGTVKSRHHLALKQLRRHMDERKAERGETSYVH